MTLDEFRELTRDMPGDLELRSDGWTGTCTLAEEVTLVKVVRNREELNAYGTDGGYPFIELA